MLVEGGGSCRVCVVLPAAGSGERFGGGRAEEKQFRPILGRPLISFSLETFLKFESVDVIILIVQKSKKEYVQSLIPKTSRIPIRIVAGDSTRHKSIRNVIPVLEEFGFSGSDVVILQDGVRPFCSAKHFNNVLSSTVQHKVCGTWRSLVSTILQKQEKNYKCLNRSEHVASEMPQGFIFQVFRDMYLLARARDLELGTECLQLAETYGRIPPVLLEGDDLSWKITYPKDLDCAASLIKSYNLEEATIVGEVPALLSKSVGETFTRTKYLTNLTKEDFKSYASIFLSPECSETLSTIREWISSLSDWVGMCVILVRSEPLWDEDYLSLVEVAKTTGTTVQTIVIPNTRTCQPNTCPTQTDGGDLSSLLMDLVVRRQLSLSGQNVFFR